VSVHERVRRLIGATKAWRVVFAVYAAALFVGTHWPNLKVDVPGVARPDLAAHLTIFAGWFGLFWLSGLVGEALRWRSLAIAAVVAVMYAGVDEGLQAVPWVRRNAAMDDYLANCAGIMLGAAAAGLVIFWIGQSAGAISRREQA
jgi:VanZ family protein